MLLYVIIYLFSSLFYQKRQEMTIYENMRVNSGISLKVQHALGERQMVTDLPAGVGTQRGTMRYQGERQSPRWLVWGLTSWMCLQGYTQRRKC